MNRQLCLLSLLLLLTAYNVHAQSYQIVGTIGQGGTKSEGGSYLASAIIGQNSNASLSNPYFLCVPGFWPIALESMISGSQILPPTELYAEDVPNDNGYHIYLSWQPSLSEDSGNVSWYRIYRSRNDVTEEIRFLSEFTTLNDLIDFEQTGTVLVDSVSAGTYEYTDTVPVNSVQYYYWLDAVYNGMSSQKAASNLLTFVENEPDQFILFAAFPNPFNSQTTIRYNLPHDVKKASIKIYDIRGTLVCSRPHASSTAGFHTFVWNGLDDRGYEVSSGVYFYQVNAGTFIDTGQMTLIR